MRNENDKGKKIIWILSVIIAVLVLALVYFLVISPQIENKNLIKEDNLRIEGFNYAIGSILANIQQQGYVEIPIGNESLILVPYMPEQIQSE